MCCCLTSLFGRCANGSNAAFVRFCAGSLVWWSCSIASAVPSVGGRSLEPLSRLAAVCSCPLSAAFAPFRNLSCSSSVSVAPGPLHPSCCVYFSWSSQVPFLREGQSFPDFVPDAAQPFISVLVARCHPQYQVRDEEGNLAPESLGWSCRVGSCCLHCSVKACSRTAAYLRSSPLEIHWIVCS